MPEAQVNKQSKSTHAGHAVSNTKRGLWWSFILTGTFFAVELVIGLRIGSVAVVADAAHNFSAAAGVGVALLAVIFASKPPTPNRTFGFLKAEILSAWVNGMVLFVMAWLILKMGVNNLFNPGSVDTAQMIFLAVVGLIIGGIPAAMLYKKQKIDINVRGAFWHVMETVFGSAAVLAAALLVRYTGWLQADAVLGMLLAPVLVVAAWGIVKTSTRSLLDLTPKNLNLVDIKSDIESMAGVVNVHHIHAWSVGSEKDSFTAHVKVLNAEDGQRILEQITSRLKKNYNIYFSTIQVETKCSDLAAKEIDFV